MKKEYMKPTMRVFELQHRSQILAGSGGDPTPGVPWWTGEAGARRRGTDVWDDEDDWEDE